MIINFTYIQAEINKKVQRVAPISSVREVRHNPFNNQYCNTKQNGNPSFEEILEERIKVYQKETQK